MQNRKIIQIQLQEINRLAMNMLNSKCMFKGSFGKVYRRCGKPNCRCAQPGSKAHPNVRVTWFENGTNRTLSIKASQEKQVKMLVNNYRNFKKNRTELKKVYEKMLNLFTQLENEIVENTKVNSGLGGKS